MGCVRALPTPSYLMVPAGQEDETSRLLKKNRVRVSPLWSSHSQGGEILFLHRMSCPGFERTPKRAPAPGATKISLIQIAGCVYSVRSVCSSNYARDLCP